jgi:outer membrane protein OmpA-like peptidoglycan-associated protein
MKLITLSAALLALSAMTFAAAPADTARTVAKATAPVAAAPPKTAAAPAKPAAPVKGSAYYKKVFKALEDSIPANAIQAKLSLAEAKARVNRIVYLEKELPKSEEIASQAKACSLYVELIRVEARTQAVRNNVSANWQKRMQTQQQIETTQERIGEERSGKASTLAADLDAERTRLAQTNKAMTDQQAQADSAAARLKRAAAAREDSLNKLLAEERAKAEARQNEARNKLNELQSKLIQVTQDARGIILSMSDILFDVDKATLKPDLQTSLAKIAGILSVYQELDVSVEGHTDNTGTAEHNMKLSEQRAQNVLDFLVKQGIEGKRLSAKGYGMTMPVADNATKEGRQKNRRVDLVIKDTALNQPAQAK